ncbi:hypothetical protein MMC06_000629 [Schaereria dolodes]|nr:hypothetical protein [Schaereria dolodes]
MPRRQLTATPASKVPKVKRRTIKRSLNALAIAEHENPEKLRVQRHRLGEIEQGTSKRKRYSPEYDSEVEHSIGKASKRARHRVKERFGNDVESGSDSEGNEWKIGELNSGDDSDLDSDEALGPSDEERFEGFTFRRSSNPSMRKILPRPLGGTATNIATLPDVDLNESEKAEFEEDSDDFGDEAVDLAAMLDDSDDEDQEALRQGQAVQLAFENGNRTTNNGESVEYDDTDLSISEAEDGTDDPTRLSALQTLVTSMNVYHQAPSDRGASINDTLESTIPSEFGLNSKQKLTVADLLPSVTDPRLKKSLKILADIKRGASDKPNGVPQKLEVPLAKRQQDRLDRVAAYEKSKETLNRWIDTITHNRRAEYLSFPLQDPEAVAAKVTKRLLPITQSLPLTTLEATIENILADSGLATKDGISQDKKIQAFEELQTNKLPIEEVQARRVELRKARELLFREEIRAKRIKKIKSKSFRRIHRRERERNALQETEAFNAAGGEQSEDERERNDRRRAEERMGARHRESKWARHLKEGGRAAWDDDARNGVAEMARRNEELRRRIEGKEVQSEDDDSLSSKADPSDNEDELSDRSKSLRHSDKLRYSLGRLESEVEPLSSNGGQNSQSTLASMKFMQRAEAARRKKNNAEIERLRREANGEESSSEDQESSLSGRRRYGPSMNVGSGLKHAHQLKSDFEERPASDDEDSGDLEKAGNENVEVIVDQAPINKKSQRSKLIPGGSLRGHIEKVASRPTKEAENPWLSYSTKSNRRIQDPQSSEKAVLISNTSSLQSTASDDIGQIAPRMPRLSLKDIKLVADKDDESFSGFSNDNTPEPNTPPSLSHNRALIRQAFAGDEVLADFEKEKEETVRDEEEKVIDNTLPGWGAWVGAGISKREMKRTEKKRKDLTKEEGIKAERRADKGVERVIINEKRVKKVR